MSDIVYLDFPFNASAEHIKNTLVSKYKYPSKVKVVIQSQVQAMPEGMAIPQLTANFDTLHKTVYAVPVAFSQPFSYYLLHLQTELQECSGYMLNEKKKSAIIKKMLAERQALTKSAEKFGFTRLVVAFDLSLSGKTEVFE